MRRANTGGIAVFAVTLAAAFLPIAAGQNTSLRYEAHVTLKLIQVYVNDKKDRPVNGLTAADFDIIDNGRPQKIIAFEVHARPALPAAPAVAPAAAVPSPSPAPRPAPSKPDLPRNFFLLIDYFRNDISGIAMAKKTAAHFLETQVRPADETALLAYSINKGLSVECPPTTDHRAVLEALRKLRQIPYLDDGIKAWPLETIGADENTVLRERAELSNNFSAALVDLAKYLRVVPGFKHLILYSRGISRDILGGNVAPDAKEGIDPSDSMEADIWGGKLETGGFTIRNYEEMIRELGSADSAIYAVNTQGLKGYYRFPQESVEAAQNRLGGDNLKQMADITGGKYFADAIHYEEIDRAIEETTSHYYVLGYSLSEKQDGAYHSLKVSVKNGDLRVRAPQGYFNPRPFKETTAFEKEIHLLSLARMDRGSGPVPFSFGAAAFVCPGPEPGRVLLLAEIPAEQVKSAFGSDSEVAIFVFTKDEGVVYSARGAINFTRLPDQKIFGYLAIPLEPGDYDCRIVFRDLTTGQGAVASASVSWGAGDSNSAAFRLYPPLLFRVKEPVSFLQLTRQDTADVPQAENLLQQIYRFVSNRSFPIVDEVEAGQTEWMAAILLDSADPDDPVGFRGEWINEETGRAIPIVPVVVSSESRGTSAAYLLAFELPDSGAGSYRLVLDAKNDSTGKESRAQRTFRVRR